MPKPTFDQILPEKRERTLQAAASLFAEQGFHRTDVAQIAALAGVAKGSLYNYFDSKEDLYLHVCKDGVERSRQAVYEEMGENWDIFQQVEHIFRKGTSFALEHPEYIRMYLNVSSAGMEGFADQLSLEVEKYTADHLKKAINKGIEKGIVRSDLNVPLAAFLINSLYIMFLVSLISRHFQVRMKEYLQIEEDLNIENIEHHLTSIIKLIHRFLRPAGRGGAISL
jgi:AcrR family transcriptional regulator